MRLADQKGFGLLLLISLMTVSMILTGSIVTFMVHASNHSVLRLNKVRAHYLAQGGVMRALYDRSISYGLDDSDASYASAPWAQGGDSISTDFMSNYALFSSDGPVYNAQFWPLAAPDSPNPPAPVIPQNSYCTSVTLPAGNYQLYGWTLQNVHSSNTLVVTHATIRWTGDAAPSQMRLSTVTASNKSGIEVFKGTAQNGVPFKFKKTAVLTPGTRWTGPCTYIRWNGAVPDPFRFTVQFTFSDGSQSSEIVFWDGRLNGQGRPHARTFSITSSGQSGTDALRQTKKVRATVATGVPEEPPHQMRILSWESLER